MLIARERPLTSRRGQVLIFLSATVFALLIGAGLMLIMGVSPIAGYRELIIGMVGSKHSIAESLLKATPLLIIGLGITIAFKASVWNIGAEGQFYIGALISTWVALSLGDLPGYVVMPLVIIAASTAGGIWGAIVGYLRAFLEINEIIVTVMLNYIAIWLVRYMVQRPLRETGAYGSGFPQTNLVAETVRIPILLPGTRLHIGFLGALILALIVFFLLRHTTFGYRLRAVGMNIKAAQYAGIDTKATIVWAMVVSGAISGLAGFVEVFGLHYRLLDGISPGYGFVGIVVTLLGGQSPLGMVIASVLIASLDVGARTMQRGIGVPTSLVTTIEYLMVILVVSASILQTHQLVPFWKRLRRNRK